MLGRLEARVARRLPHGDQRLGVLGVGPEAGPLPGEQRPHDPLLFAIGFAPHGDQVEVADLRRVRRAALEQHPLRQGSGGLHEARLVQQDERLQRRVRPRSPHHADLPAGRVEGRQDGRRDGALPDGVHAAPVEALAVILDVDLLGGGRAAEVAHLTPEAIGLIGAAAGAADARREEPARREGDVPDELGLEPEAWAPRQEAVARISLEEARRDRGVLAVRGGEDDLPQHRLHVPAALHELHREPIEELGVTRQRAPHAEVLGRLHQAGAEQELPVGVHRHASGQRMVRPHQPAGEAQAVRGGLGVHGREDRRGPGLDLVPLLVVDAAHQDVRRAPHAALLHDHGGGHGLRLDG